MGKMSRNDDEDAKQLHSDILRFIQAVEKLELGTRENTEKMNRLREEMNAFEKILESLQSRLDSLENSNDE